MRPSDGSARMRAFIGLGSNLGDRGRTIEEAVKLLRAYPEVEIVSASELHETEPWGSVAQPRFLNGAVEVETTLEPRALLGVLLDVERRLGRVREERWGPRTVDLDLLLYGDVVVDEPGLTVPHPRLHERVFALQPLHELDPALVVPGRGTVAELLRGLENDDES
jgi:2-amino-4-hydroxy-6-hydroxymethyldihydropteridine diphosphokinase